MSIEKLKQKLLEMEELIEDDAMENHDELMDLHSEIEELIYECFDEYPDKEYKIKSIEKKFKQLNTQWESPEIMRDTSYDYLFPDGEDDGFDTDDFLGLD